MIKRHGGWDKTLKKLNVPAFLFWQKGGNAL